jgi:hypothetical protein
MIFLPTPANDNQKPDRLLRYCELNDTRGITYPAVICTRWKAKTNFPSQPCCVVVIALLPICFPIGAPVEKLGSKMVINH